MSCASGNCGKKEQYGPVRLDWGVYPMGEQYDMGGCHAGAGDGGDMMHGPSHEEEARVAHYKHNMEQRGGNNPYQFEACPERLRYEVGTGCMNPGCMCHNCQGDCKCTRQGRLTEGFSVLGHDLKFWLIAGLVAYLVYHFMSKKSRK